MAILFKILPHLGGTDGIVDECHGVCGDIQGNLACGLLLCIAANSALYTKTEAKATSYLDL